MPGFRLVQVNAYGRSSGRVSGHVRGSVNLGMSPSQRRQAAMAAVKSVPTPRMGRRKSSMSSFGHSQRGQVVGAGKRRRVKGTAEEERARAKRNSRMQSRVRGR